MKYIVIIPLEHSSPALPPFDSQDGYQLQYAREGGGVSGGLEGCLGNVPNTVTAMVVIDTTPAMLAEMESRGACVFLEEVVDASQP